MATGQLLKALEGHTDCIRSIKGIALKSLGHWQARRFKYDQALHSYQEAVTVYTQVLFTAPTVIGVAGYWLYKSGRFWLAYLCLVIYSFSGLDSLGHYLYGAMSEFSTKMHLFIITDGLTGLAILGFTLGSGLLLREQFTESDTSC